MSKRKFFWIDLEMSGLDPEQDKILEVAVVITNKALEPIHEFSTAVYQPQDVLDTMNDWCKENHSKSGLTDRVPTGMGIEELDARLLDLAIEHFKKNPIILCGNSIAHDRRFILKHLPLFSQKLHYRMLDVTSFKIVMRDIFGREYLKNNKHLALDDVKESISELKYYMSAIDPNKLMPIGSAGLSDEESPENHDD